MSLQPNRRILTVDDTPAIHEDYRKILGASGAAPEQQQSLAAARAAFFGKPEAPSPKSPALGYTIDNALQGQDALALVQKSLEEKRPYAVAFVDIRMPPGWDGVRTIQELWRVDPALQCVICTAFSDYSWEQTVDTLGRSDKLLILKKPFDPVEIRQLATALTEKWNSTAREAAARTAIEAKEAEARAYAASLETANLALRTSKAGSDRAADLKRAFLERLTQDVGDNLRQILDDLVERGQVDGLEATLDRSQRLMETVARALDLSRLEQGVLGVQLARCELREVMERVEARHAKAAEAKGLKFFTAVGPDVPAAFECDGGRLSQVLDQLVENAIRFTCEGSVGVRVRVEPSSNWTVVRLRFDVEDTGQGIDPDESGALFEPFRAKDRGQVRAGSGLGLAVARQVARLLGGEVTYDPRPGGGTAFHLALEARRL